MSFNWGVIRKDEEIHFVIIYGSLSYWLLNKGDFVHHVTQLIIEMCKWNEDDGKVNKATCNDSLISNSNTCRIFNETSFTISPHSFVRMSSNDFLQLNSIPGTLAKYLDYYCVNSGLIRLAPTMTFLLLPALFSSLLRRMDGWTKIVFKLMTSKNVFGISNFIFLSLYLFTKQHHWQRFIVMWIIAQAWVKWNENVSFNEKKC